MSNDPRGAAEALDELRAALAEQAAAIEADERRIDDVLTAYLEQARR